MARIPLLLASQLAAPTVPPLFSGVDFELHPGERLAIVGPEGCGKSLLMALLAGIVTPVRGVVTLLGRPLSTYDDAVRATLVGVFFQRPVLLTPSVGEEVALGLAQRGLAAASLTSRVAVSLARAGLGLALDHPTAGLPPSAAARLQWAAVLAMEPRLLLLDEAGGDLSQEGEAQMAVSLADPGEGATIVFTSRPQRARRFASRFLTLTREGLRPLEV